MMECKMIYGCTYYFCYKIVEHFAALFGDKCFVSRFCDKNTRLPFPSEVVMLYDIGHMTVPKSLFHTYVVRLMNQTSVMMKVYPIYNISSARSFMAYELYSHNFINGSTESSDYVTHKVCILKNSYKTVISDTLLYVSYGVIGSIIIVILIYIVLICIAMCIGDGGTNKKSKRQISVDGL